MVDYNYQQQGTAIKCLAVVFTAISQYPFTSPGYTVFHHRYLGKPEPELRLPYLPQIWVNHFLPLDSI